ncbi:MAG: enoyl-CoA hydratase [Gammaproteobacteria bacterium]|nr:enoyl-CoA hydratase [Gammaproteobacteria bacterium]MCP5424612.1 enoyl-CoA hydratase [Gammaproteobacteria bacterium]
MTTTTTASAVSEEVLLRHDEAGITTLTLNRPRQYNALSQALLADLQNTLDALAEDDSVRVVIITGSGQHAFCAGHDLKEMRSHVDPAYHQALFEQCSRMMLTINRLPKPVIAQVNGIATAAGCQLVAACDLAVAADNARFATSGINVGLFCATPAVPLSRNLNRKQAMHLLLTGDFIDARTALAQGLINQVTDIGDLPLMVRRLAETIGKKSPLAVKLGKEMFYKQLEMDLEAAYRYASGVMACNMDSEDAREGIDAFFAKRQPRWQGQ